MKDESHRLVKKAIKGNKSAFEKLIQQNYERIYRTAYIYVHNEEDALDVVQEATYQALVSIRTLKNPEYFMTWFTRIVIRCSGQILKRKGNVVPLSERYCRTYQNRLVQTLMNQYTYLMPFSN